MAGDLLESTYNDKLSKQIEDSSRSAKYGILSSDGSKDTIVNGEARFVKTAECDGGVSQTADHIAEKWDSLLVRHAWVAKIIILSSPHGRLYTGNLLKTFR